MTSMVYEGKCAQLPLNFVYNLVALTFMIN